MGAEWWLVALLSSVFVLALAYDRTTSRLDSLVYDLLVRRDAREPDPRILLVTIDSRSLQEVGPWPWPRDVQARLLRGVAAGAPKAVVYDVLLLEEGEDAAADAELARAVADGPPTFLPLLIDTPGSNGAAFDAVLPFDAIRQRAAGIGHVNLAPDSDGLFRRVRLSEGTAARHWPHLMELMRQAAGSGNPPSQAHEPDAPPVLIPFAGPAGHFPSLGAAAVLRGEVPPEILDGRLVVVGATAQGLGDSHPTPSGQGEGVMSGVEIQANILDGLLTGRFVSEGGFVATGWLAIAPLWILLAGFRLLSPRSTVGLVVVLALLAFVGAALSLLYLRVWITPVPALAGLAIVYPFWSWRKLSAVSAYMLHQLEQLRAEPDVLSRASVVGATADPVTRQVLLLDDAITGLRDMRRFVSDSLHQLPDAVFVIDEEGRTLLANRKAGDILRSLGIEDDTPQMRALFAKMRPVPDSAPEPDHAVAISWPPASDGRLGDFWTSDGRCFEVLVGTRHEASGRDIGRLVRFNDVSDVQAARRQREDMLNFLTHDMRSPQASIIATLAMAKRDEISPGLADRVNGYARRTLQLVDGFVQLARAEMPQYRLEILNLSDLLIDAVDDLWPQIRSRRITVNTSGDNREWLVAGERSLLTRALINLLDNAIKYSPEGSEIHCALAPCDVQRRPEVLCSISDRGPGIAAEQLDTLFERFGRAGEAARVQGAGLGLTFVQTVVTRHGGSVECSSEPGKGAIFTLALPLCEQRTD